MRSSRLAPPLAVSALALACGTPAPNADAFNLPDAALEATDTATDAYAAPDAFVADLVVTNTRASGPGSLVAVIAFVNARCGAMRDVVTFDIPPSDTGYLTVRGQSFWRIEVSEPIQLTCPVVIDGTTQTGRHGNTNTKTFGGMPAGMRAVPLPLIEGPEIELRGVRFRSSAAGVELRGLAFSSFETSMPDCVITQSLLGSEVYDAVPTPRVDTRLVYAEHGITLRSNVFVWNPGTAIGIFAGDRGIRIEDNLMTGAGFRFQVQTYQPIDAVIQHNALLGLGFASNIEWFQAMGGSVTENTFGAMPFFSSGVPDTESGNVLAPPPP
jgi:hypothetical protein